MQVLRSRRGLVEVLLVGSALLVGLWLRVGYLDRRAARPGTRRPGADAPEPEW